MDFTTTTALVTGGNRGLGRHFVDQLVDRGARVYAGARNPEQVATRPGVTPIHLDVTDPHSIAAAAARAVEVTLLINNAGIERGTSLLTGDLEDIAAEFDANFYGTLRMLRAFADPIAANGGGAVLNVLSVLSWITFPNVGGYSASKAASWSLTNEVRQELAPRNIHVAALHVGYMDTDMARAVTAPKTDPAVVAGLALDGLAAGDPEILADELSRKVRKGLAGGVAALYPAVV